MTNLPILLVEDDPNDVFFFERAAKKAGINSTVHSVRDGQEAVSYLNGEGAFADRAAYPFPVLMVLDLNLPQRHGLEVLRWLRQNKSCRTLLVVVLTSSRSEVDIHEAYELGANSYLVKPSDPADLTQIVELVKVYWLGRNEPPPECARAAGAKRPAK